VAAAFNTPLAGIVFGIHGASLQTSGGELQASNVGLRQ
jgi:H+/Cl- antiporter ClcA